MPTFKIIDTFHITNKGQVLSGILADNEIVLTGDIAILSTEKEKVNIEIIGVSKEKENNRYGLLISTSDFERINSNDLKESVIKIKNNV